jgi:hypothetical protein
MHKIISHPPPHEFEIDLYMWEHLEGGWIGDPVKLQNLSHKNLLSVSTIMAKWLEWSRNTIATRNQSQRWHGGYPVVRPSTKLAYSTLWRPNGRELHSTPLKWSTWIPRCSCFSFLNPVCEESPQLGASRPYKRCSQRITEQGRD